MDTVVGIATESSKFLLERSRNCTVLTECMFGGGLAEDGTMIERRRGLIGLDVGPERISERGTAYSLSNEVFNGPLAKVV